jgi:hypothetical protein
MKKRRNTVLPVKGAFEYVPVTHKLIPNVESAVWDEDDSQWNWFGWLTHLPFNPRGSRNPREWGIPSPRKGSV